VAFTYPLNDRASAATEADVSLDRQQVRLRVGDYDANRPLWSDAHVDAALAAQGSVLGACVFLVKSRLALIARDAPSVSAAGVSTSRDERAALEALLTSLEIELMGSVSPYAGGTTVAEFKADATDEGLVQPQSDRSRWEPR
jgi:hypothetical protein